MSLRHISLIIFITFFCSATVFGQKFFSDQEKFIEDVKVFMSKPNNERTQGGVSAITAAYSKLNDEQKNTVYAISKKMYKKGFRPDGQFVDFYLCLNNSKLTDDKLNQFLAVSDTTVQEMKPIVANNFFRGSRRFLEESMLYRYKDFNSLGVEGGGDFSFKFSREVAIETHDQVYEDITENVDDNAGVEGEEVELDEIPEESTSSNDDGWGANDGWDTDDSSGGDNDGWGSDDGWGDADEWNTSDDDGWGSDDGWGDTEETTNNEDVQEEKEDTGPIEFSEEEASALVYEMPEADSLPLWGPHLHFENVTLVMKQYNEIKIEKTSGDLLMATNQFVGKGGKVDWGIVGKPEVSVELDNYVFNIRKAHLKAHRAALTYNEKLDSAILGAFEFKSVKQIASKAPVYPRFKSYYSNITFKNYVPDVTYRGGFSLTGTKVSGDSFDKAEHEIFLTKNDTVKFRAFSQKGFGLNDKSITNLKSRLIIYLGDSDSLMHPAMRLRYDASNGVLKARKNKKEYKYAPFIDTYHRTEISADFLIWDVAQDTFNVSIIAGRTEVPAVVESQSRFSEVRFDKIQSFYNFHPLVAAYGYAVKNRKRSFRGHDLAQAIGYTGKRAKQVTNSMREMAQGGYVQYDEANDIVRFTQKGILYARANRERVRPSGKVDYDNIFLTSIIGGGQNMTYYLENKDLKVRGVDTILFNTSDSMQVKAAPLGKEVIIKENRDMEFAGVVKAKRFLFNGVDFKFSYKNFKIDMPQIDSMQFMADTLLPNNFKALSGVFQISHPRNKSGLRKMPKYPIFETGDGGYVNFNGKEVLDGAYNDSLIQFDVKPFTMDSISNRKPEEMEFAGVFKSSGIFPDFEQPLAIMPDRSLGFVHQVPDDGYDLYGGKGKFISGQIRLDNDGLRASSDKHYYARKRNNQDDDLYFGRNRKQQDSTYLTEDPVNKIEYLSASLESNDFLFFSDSVTTLNKNKLSKSWANGKITSESADVPYVNLAHYRLKWLVKEDSMLLQTTDTAFQMYDVSHQIRFTKGTLGLTPSGLGGDGIIDTEKAEIKSPLFAFNKEKFSGRNSEYFNIKSEDPSMSSLVANNVKFEYDLTKQMAKIDAEDTKAESFTLPYVKYKTSLANATWQIKSNNITFGVGEGDPKNQYFKSTREDQKGLMFNAGFANYGIKTHDLNIGGVSDIIVLDTRIIPYEGSVVIRKGGEMDELEKAELNISIYTDFYHLTDGKIKIKSSEDYAGEASYSYINDADASFKIQFTDFEKRFINEESLPDSTKNLTKMPDMINKDATFSVSAITEEENFIISEGKQFKGAVTMEAWNPELQFKGEVRLTLGGGAWIPLEANNEIVVGEGGVNGQKIAVGIFYNKKDHSLYTATMTPKQNDRDIPLIEGKGTVKVDETRQLAMVISEERKSGGLGGNSFQYSPPRKDVYFDGKLNMMEPHPKFNLAVAGLGKGNYTKKHYTIDALMGIKLETSGNVFKLMGEQMELFLEQYRSADDIKRTVNRKKRTLYKLAAISGENDAKKFSERFSPGNFSIANILDDYALVFSDIILKWSDKHKAFYSFGQLGISNVFKMEIDAKMKGFVEISKADGNTATRIYIELGHNQWYYIEQTHKTIKMLSADEDLNLEISNPKSKDKFELAEMSEKNAFISRFRASYGDHSDSTEKPNLLPPD